MTNKRFLQKLQTIENNARRLLEDAAALREELSGGSDSSLSSQGHEKHALSPKHREKLLKRRRASAFTK